MRARRMPWCWLCVGLQNAVLLALGPSEVAGFASKAMTGLSCVSADLLVKLPALKGSEESSWLLSKCTPARTYTVDVC